MWTPDRDAELRRLGAETYIARYPGADAQEVQDRWLILTGAGGLSPAPPAVCRALRVSMVMIQKPSAAGRRCAGRCAVTATASF